MDGAVDVLVAVYGAYVAITGACEVLSKNSSEQFTPSMEWRDFHSLSSEFHSILTPEEWQFTTQRVESRPVHSIFTPKEVITDVNTQGVKIEWKFTLFFFRV